MNRLHFLATALALAGLFAVAVGCEKKETPKSRDTGRNAMANNAPMMNNMPMNNGSSFSPSGQDIIVTLQNQGKFDTLLKLIDAAGLTETLKGGQFTIFAPTDDAFKAANISVYEWTKPENKEKLARLLKAHVIKQAMSMDDLQKQDKLESLSGRVIKVTKTDDQVEVSSIKITGRPIEGTNGEVYTVEKVMATGEEAPTTMPTNK